MSRHRSALLAAGVPVLLGVLAGCGSSPAPTPEAGLTTGRSIQRTCPLVADALRKGFTSTAQLQRLAAGTDRLVRAGDRETRLAVSSLPDDARALAAAPDSKQALSALQRDVTRLQRQCTKQGVRLSY